MSVRRELVLVRRGDLARAFEMRESPLPLPAENEVRVAVETSGVNFADVMTRLGLYQDAPRIPFVPGFDVAGRVDAVGAGVRSVSPGMRVVAMTRFGGYATHVLAKETGLAPIPEDYDTVAATALGTQYVTAWYAAREMVRLHPGDRVLIHSAAGGVGTALVQIAHMEKCTVVGTTGSARKLKHLESLGVDYPLLVEGTDIESSYRRALGDRRPDVIFDPIGGTMSRSGFKLLGAGGRLVCYGVSRMVGMNRNLLRSVRAVVGFGFPHPVVMMIHSKAIIGINLLRVGDERPEVLHRCLKAAVEEAVAGRLRPVTFGAFPAHEVARVHRMIMQRETVGKVALSWVDGPVI